MDFLKKNKLRIIVNTLMAVVFVSPLFVMAQTSSVPSHGNPLTRGWYLCDCCTKNTPCSLNDFFILLKTLIDALLFATFPIAVIVIIMGGFKILTAQENTGKMGQGKKMVTWAVYGMLITFGSWLIVNTLLSTLTGKGLTDWTKVFH
jgi:hypothetical protein